MTEPQPPCWGQVPPNRARCDRLRIVRADAQRDDWQVIVTGFLLYASCFVVGAISGKPALNLLGSGVMLAWIAVLRFRSMLNIRRDITVALALAIIALAAVATEFNPVATEARYGIKLVYMGLFYILIYNLRLRPIYRSRYRWHLLGIVMGLLLISLVRPSYDTDSDFERAQGLFVNPNSLALMALAIPFLIDTLRDPARMQMALLGIVGVIVLLTGTSGAILGYLGGIGWRYLNLSRDRSWRKRLMAVWRVALLLAIGGGPLLWVMAEKSSVGHKLQTQYELLDSELPFVLAGGMPDYGQLYRHYGASSLSGLWRIAHWMKGLSIYSSGDLRTRLFGFGVGSTGNLLGMKPHNDYLRILMEQGLVGFLLNLCAVLVVLRRVPREYRYCLVIFLLFCLTENNIDNILYMTMLILFAASAQTVRPETAPAKRRRLQVVKRCA
jgi:hypothetical protein